MKKLLIIALLLGLIVLRMHAREYPPLPIARERTPIDAPGTPARPVFARWNVVTACLDVFEMSPDAETWSDVPGPYEVLDLDGTATYNVRVPVGYAKAFFRVRRVWGNPWVN